MSQAYGPPWMKESELRPLGPPSTVGPNWGTAPLPRRVMDRQGYRRAIRGPRRKKQQDEAAGHEAAWAATSPKSRRTGPILCVVTPRRRETPRCRPDGPCARRQPPRTRRPAHGRRKRGDGGTRPPQSKNQRGTSPQK